MPIARSAVRRHWWPIAAVAGLAVAAAAPTAVAAGSTPPILVSSGSTGPVGVLNVCAPSPAVGPTFQGSLLRPAPSALGRVVAFRSNAGGLVPGVPGGLDKIYAKDMVTGRVTLVSVAADGGLPNGPSEGPSISWDGRFVAFSSCATNLVNPPTTVAQTYVRDLWTGRTQLVSVASDGTPADAGFAGGQPTSGETAISADGRYVTFVSLADNLAPLPAGAAYPPGVEQVYLRDRLTGTTQLISRSDDGLPGNASSERPAISGLSTDVVFESAATNLVPVDLNPGIDVFLRDFAAGHTELVDLDLNGVQASPGTTSNRPTISATGQYVAFRSNAKLTANDLNSPAVGPGTTDVYIRDRFGNRTILASVDSNGQQAPPAPGLDFQGPNIDGTGREVAFYTVGMLVPDDTNGQNDVYVHNWVTGSTQLVDRMPDGSVPPPVPGGRSFDPELDATGLVVAYTSSYALSPSDTNGMQDTYLNLLLPQWGALRAE